MTRSQRRNAEMLKMMTTMKKLAPNMRSPISFKRPKRKRRARKRKNTKTSYLFILKGQEEDQSIHTKLSFWHLV